jgi:hypothetical protein
MDQLKEKAAAFYAKIKDIDLKPEDIISQVVKVPGIKIDRAKFLRKELSGKYSEEVVEFAIANNPAAAGITKEEILPLAKAVINYETNKTTFASFVAGIPGSAAMFGTIPADVIQYFGFMLRVLQELAYLYGFSEFELNENEIPVDTMNELLIFLGAMMGIQEANVGIKVLGDAVAKNIAKKLANKPLMQGAIYPIVKKIARFIGVRMTREIFATSVSKVVPVVGGVVSGGLTYASFKPCAIRLRKVFSKLNLCDPETYRSGAAEKFDDAIDIEFKEI